MMLREITDEQLKQLARGPLGTILTFQGYEINGYTFYTRAQDKKSTNQNSGVRIDAIDNKGNKEPIIASSRRYGRWSMDL